MGNVAKDRSALLAELRQALLVSVVAEFELIDNLHRHRCHVGDQMVICGELSQCREG
jgi:hypothetical protein